MSIDAPNHIDSCLLRNNCLTGGDTASNRQLTSAQKKSAESFRLEFDSLVASLGIKPLLFVTLTFAEPVPDRVGREAQCLKFRKSVLEAHFEYGFTVFDRSATGRPHYHFIAVSRSGTDFHTGFDFAAWDAGQAAERKWNKSQHTDHAAERQWRGTVAASVSSAGADLRVAWEVLQAAAERFGFGRINALPIKDAVACGLYLAKCVTNGFRDDHPDDRGVRRVRFWGSFPRRVCLKFQRVTERSTRWRGKVAFCAHVLGFRDFDDFARCFGPRWFIYLKGIIRLVPNRVADASILSPHLPLQLIEEYRSRIEKIETELLDRVERFGRPMQSVR